MFGHSSGRSANVARCSGRLEQQANSVAQQVNCGLEARRQHQPGSGEKLLVAEVGPVVAGFDDLAHQVVAGIAPQLVQVVGEPVVEALDAAIHPLVLRPRQPDVQAGRGQLTELQDARPRFLGHAEDVADDADRQLGTVLVHDVDDAGVVAEVVEQLAGGVADPITKRRNRSGGEHRRNQLAVAGVVGRFDREHRRRFERVQQPGLGAIGHPLQRFGQVRTHRDDAEVIGPQHVVNDLVVDGDEQEAASHDRALRAQFFGERHRVGTHGRVRDQPALRVAALRERLGHRPNHAVDGEPPDPLPHAAELTTGSIVLQVSNSTQARMAATRPPSMTTSCPLM